MVCVMTLRIPCVSPASATITPLRCCCLCTSIGVGVGGGAVESFISSACAAIRTDFLFAVHTEELNGIVIPLSGDVGEYRNEDVLLLTINSALIPWLVYKSLYSSHRRHHCPHDT